MSLRNRIHKEEIYSAYLFSSIIPVFPKLLGYGVLLFIMEIVFKGYKNIGKGTLNKVSLNNTLFWCIGFYMAHVIGLLWTENMDFAAMDLGMKSSFIIIPTVLALFPVKVDFQKIKNAFVIGALFSIIICFTLSTINYLENGKIWMFREFYLSHFMHRSYWSAYLLIAFTFITIDIIRNERFKFLQLLALPVFILTIILAGSKIIYICLFLLLLFFFIYWVVKSRKYVQAFSVFFILIAVASLTLYFTPTLQQRFSNVYNTIMRDENSDINPLESTYVRLKVWDSSVELIGEKPIFGVGTGDIKDELYRKNTEKGYLKVADEKLNSHNQFFNITVALGLFGLVFLAGLLVSPLLLNKTQYKFEFSVVIFILFMSFSVESFLEIQAGIIPVAFLLSLFSIINGHKKKEKTIDEI